MRVEGKIVRLHKAIYGLKTAGRIWNSLLTDFMVKQQFTQSVVDPCMFYKEDCLICIYLDDLIIALKNDTGYVYAIQNRFTVK